MVAVLARAWLCGQSRNVYLGRGLGRPCDFATYRQTHTSWSMRGKTTYDTEMQEAMELHVYGCTCRFSSYAGRMECEVDCGCGCGCTLGATGHTHHRNRAGKC
jgi:hypothetical protein